MSYTALLLLKARKELSDTFLWYEDKQKGLGERFANQVFNKLTEIENFPDRYPVKVKNLRETRIAVFPYLLIYRLNNSARQVVVVSIFHIKRNPLKKTR
jgi:plasmid stabilization system protein ParE